MRGRGQKGDGTVDTPKSPILPASTWGRKRERKKVGRGEWPKGSTSKGKFPHLDPEIIASGRQNPENKKTSFQQSQDEP